MVDSKENDKFDLGVKGLISIQNFVCTSVILQEGSWREVLAFLSSKENLTTTFIEEIGKVYNFPESRHNSLKCVGLSSYLSQFYSCLLAVT